MRNLFIPSRSQRIVDAATIAACVLLVAFAVSAASTLDSPAPTYSSYGYGDPPTHDDAVTRAVAASQAADALTCRELHGPEATAAQLPDGSHRCVDKHGRRLSARSAISIPAHGDGIAQR